MKVWPEAFHTTSTRRPYEFHDASIVDLISIAYDTSRAGGGWPDWLEIKRFDVIAKAPAAGAVHCFHSANRCSPTHLSQRLP